MPPWMKAFYSFDQIGAPRLTVKPELLVFFGDSVNIKTVMEALWFWYRCATTGMAVFHAACKV